MIKVLAPNEYQILAQAPDGVIPDPDWSIAIAEIEDDKLIGRLFMMIVPHIEGPWIEPGYRKGRMLRDMEETLIEEMTSRGLKKLFAFAPDEEIESYLERSGYVKQPYTVWAKEI